MHRHASGGSAVTARQQYLFETYATEYSLSVSVHFAETHRSIVRQILDHNGRWLDVCCGDARLFSQLPTENRAHYEMFGIDVSKKMLKLAVGIAPYATYANGTADALPFRESLFEVVTCSFGAYFLRDFVQAADEMRRVLRRGGTLVIADYTESVFRAELSLDGILEIVQSKALQLSSRIVQNDGIFIATFK
jgi:ubiquinone/menaquinone biosynthesis C-methylase UbiE